LAKSESEEDRAHLESLLYLAFETARVSSILLQPFCPQLTSEVLAMLNCPDRKDTIFQTDKTFSLDLSKKVHVKKVN
jgi:methionyl-tRNA synthetase